MSVLFLLAGCFSVERASSPYLGAETDSHVIVSNYGWNLFGCVPICCGNAAADACCPFVFFRDDVKSQLAFDRLQALARERGCRVDNVVDFDDRYVVFDFIYAPVPWVIQYKEVNFSALLVKEER